MSEFKNGVLCVWPFTSLDGSLPQEFIDFLEAKYPFHFKFAEEVHTPDGRIDLLFWVDIIDVPKFSLYRLSTGIKWFDDFVNNGYTKGYPVDVMKRYGYGD